MSKALLLAVLIFTQAATIAPDCQEAYFAMPAPFRRDLAQSLINRITDTKAPDGSWSCRSGDCFPKVEQLISTIETIDDESFREEWLAVHVQTTEPLHQAGQPIRSSSVHRFIVEKRRQDFAEEVIIDPTYLQFLTADQSITLPEIFVGTRSDLLRIFARYQRFIRRPFIESGQTFDPTQLDVAEFVELTWGYGRAEGTRQPV